ncbi:MAG: TonB-dependent receptor, partial [Bacteroidia bacterium]|nr:TonB-dependent receptor [Bacteroidia bacterium]
MRNILVLVMLLPVLTFGQNTLTGKIINNSNQDPLPFVNIYFPQLETGTSSIEDGSFSLENLPDGKFRIIISYIGFQTFSQLISVPAKSELIIELQPSAIEMEEVLISTPFHKLQSENVMKVEQLKVNELRKNGMVTLSRAISDIPGVSSISTGLGIGKPVIRGLSSNRVLVYAQGIRLENQQFGEEHGLGISDSGIESVEVIKGPASLLYGSDALGGVLYLNPERFANQNSTAADLNTTYFSSTQGYSTNLGFKSSGKALKFLVRGSLAAHSDYENDLYRVTNSRFKERDLKAGIGFQKSKFKTDLRYNINDSNLGLPEEIGDQSTDKNPILPNQELQNHILSSKSSWFFPKSILEMNLGYISNDRKEFEEHDHGEEEEEGQQEEEEGPALHMKLKTFNYNLQYSINSDLKNDKTLETIVGIQGMIQDNANFGEELLIPDARTTDFGIMATSHIHFEKVGLQFGARFDTRKIDVEESFETNYSSFNFASGIKYDFNEAFIGRLNLASGFRAPNLAELASDGTHEGTNRYEIGNPDLNNERNFQSDLTLEHRSDHLEIMVNGFYNRVSDFIFLSPNGEFVNEDPVFVYLQDDARLYGGEIMLHFHPHPLDWLHIESSFEIVRGKQDDDRSLPLIPANILSNTLRFEFDEEWVKNGFGFLTLSHTFDQENISEFETRTGGYSLLNAGIGGTVSIFNNPLELNLSATNLLDKVYVNHMSRLKADGIPNMGRNISFGLR